MFTLRFEADSIDTSPKEDQETTLVIQAKEYRLNKKRGGCCDVIALNEHGDDVCYLVGKYPGAYDRCFVMNDNGKTIDKIVAQKVELPDLDVKLSSSAMISCKYEEGEPETYSGYTVYEESENQSSLQSFSTGQPEKDYRAAVQYANSLGVDRVYEASSVHSFRADLVKASQPKSAA
jgi:hypothetical protein